MKLMFTRPAQWAAMEADGIDPKKPVQITDVELAYVDLFGKQPKLRGGSSMGDSVGGVTTRKHLRRLIEQFEEHKPDAFLWWSTYCEEDEDEHQVESVRKALIKCKQASPRTVFFYGNGNQASTIRDNKPDFNVDAFANVIDVVLDNTCDDRIRAIYKGRGYRTDTLYTFGFDPDDIDDMGGKPAEHDVFFGGSYTGRSRFPNSAFRHELIVRLAGEFDMLVRGRGKWPKPVQKRGYVHGFKYPMEIGKCKVALGCYHADLWRYYTKRTVYSLASGRPYVVRYIPGMEFDFTHDWDLLWYKNVDEARRMVRELVNDPERAAYVGAEGRQTAINQHSWKARLADMIAIMERHL